jgi:hypothetical protein
VIGRLSASVLFVGLTACKPRSNDVDLGGHAPATSAAIVASSASGATASLDTPTSVPPPPSTAAPALPLPPNAPPMSGCPDLEARRLADRRRASPRTTLLFDGGALAVCVDATLSPYVVGRGHVTVTRLSVRTATSEETYQVEGEGVVRVKGWIVRVGPESEGYAREPEVWVEAVRDPALVSL